MEKWEIINRTVGPDQTELVLARRGSEWVVRAAGRVLMSSRTHGSEETLAIYALERVAEPSAVLVGGLGLGFTLRATLDRVPRTTRVTVAELIPKLAEWNRVHLAHLASAPLDDKRTQLYAGDVYDCLTRGPASYDLVLLDVDNGPSALAHPRNNRLYSEHGVRICWAALRPGGVIAVWSAGPDERYAKRLEADGVSSSRSRAPPRALAPVPATRCSSRPRRSALPRGKGSRCLPAHPPTRRPARPAPRKRK